MSVNLSCTCMFAIFTRACVMKMNETSDSQCIFPSMHTIKIAEFLASDIL